MNLRKRWLTYSLGVAAACALLSPSGLRAAGCGQIKPDATDAVTAAPANHKVILENDTVRVLEATVPLHSKEVPHTHFWPSVFFEQTSGINEPWKTVNVRWSAGLRRPLTFPPPTLSKSTTRTFPWFLKMPGCGC